MHQIMTAFEREQLDSCIDAVRKENASNFSHKHRSIELTQLKESVSGEHLVRKISEKQLKARTLFLRTKANLQASFVTVWLLNMFGMKWAELDSKKVLDSVRNTKGMANHTVENAAECSSVADLL